MELSATRLILAAAAIFLLVQIGQVRGWHWKLEGNERITPSLHITDSLQCLPLTTEQDPWAMVCLHHRDTDTTLYHSAQTSSPLLPRLAPEIWTICANGTQ